MKEPALTSTASRRNPFFLTVALSTGGWAWGDLFWDDGDTLNTFEGGNYCYVIFTAGQVGKRERRVIFALWKSAETVFCILMHCYFSF